MATIAEIRKQYPDYDDLSDKQLADSLYSAHYSDMDRKEFDTKIGLRGPSEVTPSVNSEMSGTQRFMRGLGQGLENTALGAGQRVVEVGQKMAELQGMPQGGGNPLLDMIKNRVASNRAEFKPLQDAANASTWPTAQGVGKAIGGTAPMLALSLIPGMAPTTIPRMMATSGLVGALQGFVEPTIGQESPAENTLTGGAAGAAFGAIPALGGKVWNAFKTKLPDTKGIKETLGEMTKNPHWLRIEAMLEKVPVLGISKFRGKQLESAEQASHMAMMDYIINPLAPDIKKANTAHIDGLYDNFKSSVFGNGMTTDAPQSKAMASTLLNRFSPVFKSLQDNDIKRVIKDIAGDTAYKKKISPILDPQGNPIVTQVPPAISVDDLWKARKGLWSAMDREYKQGNQEAYGVLSDMRNAITEDLNILSDKITPGASQVFKEANEAYKKYDVKFDLLQKAYNKATRLSGEPDQFSPALYSTELYKIADQYKDRKLFAPGEIERLTGYANIMRNIKRAGQFKENVPTSDRWALPFMAGTAGLVGTAKALPFIAVGRFLTTTDSGKKLAMAAANIEPSSRNMKVIVKMVYNQASRMAAEEAVEK